MRCPDQVIDACLHAEPARACSVSSAEYLEFTVAFEHLQHAQVSTKVYLTFGRRIYPKHINATTTAAVPKCDTDNSCACFT